MFLCFQKRLQFTFFFNQYIYYFHINNLQIEYSLQVDILF